MMLMTRWHLKQEKKYISTDSYSEFHQCVFHPLIVSVSDKTNLNNGNETKERIADGYLNMTICIYKQMKRGNYSKIQIW